MLRAGFALLGRCRLGRSIRKVAPVARNPLRVIQEKWSNRRGRSGARAEKAAKRAAAKAHRAELKRRGHEGTGGI